MQKHTCPVCQTTSTIPIITIPQVPVLCNVLCQTYDEAIGIPRGAVELVFCPQCGHVWNGIFDPSLMEYTQDYENSLHFSPTFQSYAQSLAERLVKQYDIREKDILEPGCGQGDFLRLLCQLGHNRGFGFDPSYAPERSESAGSEPVTIIPDMYTERYADYTADVVVCRHVLEHIPQPGDMLQTVGQAVQNRPNALLFFEVPNAIFTLRDLSIWDIIYEHCSFFSAGSLAYLFTLQGFDVRDVCEEFNGQFLSLVAQAVPGPATRPPQQWAGLGEMAADVETFAQHYRQKIQEWNERLAEMSRNGRKAVVWGVGSKGIMFLNTLQTRGCIEYVVDINPRKQGMYTTGSGQKIVSPEFLSEYRPEVVIVMNPVYMAEIQKTVQELGVSAEFLEG